MAAGVRRGSGHRNHWPPLDPRGARRLLRRLYGAALSGVDPEAAVVEALRSGEVHRALSGRRRVGVFAVGKAARAMARGARGLLPAGPALVVLPRGSPRRGLSGATILFASHPRPDAGSVRAARRAVRFFESFGPEDAIVCLISGGASSLLCLPRPGLSLADKRRAIDALARRGAPIQALNRLRTSLSAVKGGRLARVTRARLVTLVLSDVAGDRAKVVGSGPTVRERRGDVVRVIGANPGGIRAAAREARRLGWRVASGAAALEGEARLAARRVASGAARLAPGTLWVSGGETVVTLGASRGRGGRSLELALALAIALRGQKDMAWLAAGSDGRDGSSSAAGAFADGATITRALRRGLDARAALRLHETHAFFARLGDLWSPGSTGTNVGDWLFLLRGVSRDSPRRAGRR